MDKDMSNKEIISKVLRKNPDILSSDEYKSAFQKLTNNENPFLEGIRSIFDISGHSFTRKMQEVLNINLKDALLSDARKVQIDMNNIFEKITTDVSRKREKTVGTTSESRRYCYPNHYNLSRYSARSRIHETV
jgi:hypothetical protein